MKHQNPHFSLKFCTCDRMLCRRLLGRQTEKQYIMTSDVMGSLARSTSELGVCVVGLTVRLLLLKRNVAKGGFMGKCIYLSKLLGMLHQPWSKAKS